MAELVQDESLDAALAVLLPDRREVERDVEAVRGARREADGVGAAGGGRADVDRDEAVHVADQAARLRPGGGDLAQHELAVGRGDRRVEAQDVARRRGARALALRVAHRERGDDDASSATGIAVMRRAHRLNIGSAARALECCG